VQWPAAVVRGAWGWVKGTAPCSSAVMTARLTSPSPDFHSPRPTVGITAPVFSVAVDDIAGSKRNLCVCAKLRGQWTHTASEAVITGPGIREWH
jgi:hypothetical protein